MSIKVQCDGCAKRFSAADKLAGKRVKCPSCGAAIEIPILLLDEVVEDSLDDLLVGTPTNTEPTLVPSSKSPASSTPQPDPLAPLDDPLADLLGGDLAAGPVVVDGGSTVAAEAKRPKPVRVSAGTSRPLRFALNHVLFTLVVACVVLRLIISAFFAQFTAGVVGACVGGLIAFFVLRPALGQHGRHLLDLGLDAG